MDPFTATILKQGALFGLGAGLPVFTIFVLVKMASLQHALTLNLLPTQLP